MSIVLQQLKNIYSNTGLGRGHLLPITYYLLPITDKLRQNGFSQLLHIASYIFINAKYRLKPFYMAIAIEKVKFVKTS